MPSSPFDLAPKNLDTHRRLHAPVQATAGVLSPIMFHPDRCITAIGLLLVVIFLGGCKNREAIVPGTWKSQTLTVQAKADKTWTAQMGVLNITGSWKLDGDDAVFTPETVQGKPVAQVKAALESKLSSVPQIKQMADDIDKPNIMTISDDGKTMTTDKAKDKNSGPGMTLTKAP